MIGLGNELEPKRLELLHEIVPTATVFAVLVNAANPILAEPTVINLQAAARTLGVQLHVLSASTEQEIDTAFAMLVQLYASGLVIGADNFFTGRSEQLAALAPQYAVPTIYQYRKFAAAGGVMSYGGSITDAYRLVGVYAGRIVKGEKPADLPAQQAMKIELIINLKTAKALGITVPTSLLVRAGEHDVVGLAFWILEDGVCRHDDGVFNRLRSHCELHGHAGLQCRIRLPSFDPDFNRGASGIQSRTHEGHLAVHGFIESRHL